MIHMMMVKFSTSTSETSMILFAHSRQWMICHLFLNAYIVNGQSLEQGNFLELCFHN